MHIGFAQLLAQTMNDRNTDNSSTPAKSQDQPKKAAIDSDQIVNPSEDLVYKGGYTGDPEEIVANPAVAPEMLDDQRDNRPDLTRSSEGI